MQLLLHGLGEVLKIFGHFNGEYIFEHILNFYLDLLVLLLIFELSQTESILVLFFLLSFVIFVRGKKLLPVELIPLFFGIFRLLVCFDYLKLSLLLEIRQDIARWSYLEIQIFEGAYFDVLHRKSLIYFFIKFGCFDLILYDFFIPPSETLINVSWLFLAQNSSKKAIDSLQMEEIFHL